MEQTIDVERELGIVPSGALEIKKNGTYDVTNKATAEVAVEVPTAEMDISEDGSYDVTDYGTAKVKVNSEENPLEVTENNATFDTTHYSQVTTNIPDPTDEIDITEDGDHDVAKYGVAKVNVNNETQPLQITEDGVANTTHHSSVVVKVNNEDEPLSITEDGTADTTHYSSVEVNVNNQEEPLVITENNQTVDTTHYSSAKTQIPAPTAEIEIGDDGEYDVAEYGTAKVTVNSEENPLQITNDGTANTTHYSSVSVNVNNEEDPLEIKNDGTADTTHYSSVDVNVNYEEGPLEITDNNVTVDTTHYSQVSVAVTGASQVQSVTITNKSDFENLSFPGTYLTIPLAVSVLPATAPQMTKVVVSDSKMVRVLDNGDGTHSLHILRGGTCTVTVYDYAGAISDSFTLAINQALEDISFAYTSLNIAAGGTRQLAVQFRPSTATDQTLVWSSSHEGITVDQNGLVTATTGGHAVISAYSAAIDKTITCSIDAAVFPETSDFADVKAHPENYGVGSLLPDKIIYNNTQYDFNWRVVDADYTVTLPNGETKKATILMMDKALPLTNRFSTETAKTCNSADEPTALADTYYYGKNGSTYTELNVEVGDPLPYSDYATIYKTGLHFTKNFSNVTQSYTNRWDGSEARAILNSDADNVKNAYQPVHITDVVNYTGKGFLQMVNPALLQVVSTIRNTTIENNACFDAEAYETDDLFWLPAARQLQFNPSAYDSRPAARNDEEGTAFQYFINEVGTAHNNAADCRKIVPLGQSSAAYYWLRSANFSVTNSVLSGTSSGALGTNYAYNTYRFVPACAIIH